jgi:putative phosphonate metabolism protein
VPQRYAVYFAPAPGSALAAFGDDWLGETAPEGVDAAAWAELTGAARGYCFHATLKPPFVLAKGRTAVELDRALSAFAAEQEAFTVRLELKALYGFLALMLAEPSAQMQGLADACVVEFDRFRAPPTEAELARRRRARLSPAHEANLDRWGYPYVFDAFRFHMTLTRRLNDAERAQWEPVLRARAASAIEEPVAIDAVTLFMQRESGQPFQVVRRYPFG